MPRLVSDDSSCSNYVFDVCLLRVCSMKNLCRFVCCECEYRGEAVEILCSKCVAEYRNTVGGR